MILLYLPFCHIECIKYLIIYSIYFLSLEMHCYVNSLEFYIPYTWNTLQNNMHYDDFTQICSNNHISDDELGELRISFESLLSFRSSVFIRIENTSSSRTTLNESPTQSEYFSATEDRWKAFLFVIRNCFFIAFLCFYSSLWKKKYVIKLTITYGILKAPAASDL